MPKLGTRVATGIYKQSKNSYSIRVSTGQKRANTGTYIYYTETFLGTLEEAKRRRAEIIAEFAKGKKINQENMTVGAFLDRWLQFIDNTDLASKTKYSYHLHVEKHFKPYIVRLRYRQIPLVELRLVDLTPEILQGYFKYALINGRKDEHKVKKKEKRGEERPRALSSATVNSHYRTWHTALEWATRQGWITRNPADLTKPPPVEKKRFRRLSVAEAKLLLQSTEREWIHPLLVCALYTGMRQGEQLALRWEDIDWEKKIIIPKRTLEKAGPNPVFKNKPKTDSSLAPIPMVESLAAELKELRKKQMEQRLAAGPLWHDFGLVFTTPIGTPLSGPDLTSKHLKKVLRKAGLPLVRWHDLRHTTASLLADLGVDIKTISMILRHSTIKITADTYTEPEIGIAAKALKKLEKAIQ